MTANSPMVCVRVQQFRNWAAVTAMARHGARTLGSLSNIAPARTGLNRFESEWGDGRDPVACMKALIAHQGAKIRRNGSPGTHMLLTASPEFFRPNDPGAAGTWDSQRLDDWMAANRAWLSKRFSGQVAALRVDLDETTPHCDVFLVPLNRRTTKTGKKVVEVSHRTQFSKGRGPRGYAQLQTEYAEAMVHLGLARGRSKSETGAVHKSPVTMRAELNTAAAYSQAYAIGVRAWSDGRMTRMNWTEDRRQTARFRPDVAKSERRRLFRMCRPAWDALVALSCCLEALVRRAVGERVHHANAMVTDARVLLDDLATRDAAILEEAARLDGLEKRIGHQR